MGTFTEQSSFIAQTVDMKRVAAIVLGGGEGTRLFPLTSFRSKPALRVGGRFRLIDFPLSNAVNSDCRKIYILTQFLASSLHQHIISTYRPDRFGGGFVDLLSCQTTPNRKEWYLGTGDAVRHHLDDFLDCPVDYYLILSGDHIYRMDFRPFVQFGIDKNADLVIAAKQIEDADAPRMGIIQSDKSNKIFNFVEKPSQLGNLRAEGECLGSMGIYLFKRDALQKILDNKKGHDFGRDLIPPFIKKQTSYAYPYEGYWEDIGTVSSFYEANIALTDPDASFDPYEEYHPIYAHHSELPGAKIFQTEIESSILGEGSIIKAKKISRSILGPRSLIGAGTVIESSYLLGNDYYKPLINSSRLPSEVGIGSHCHIRKAIIDENVKIGSHVKLINQEKLTSYEGAGVFIRDGIIIVSRGTTLPDGFTL